MLNDEWYKSTTNAILAAAKDLVKLNQLSAADDEAARKAAKIIIFKEAPFKIYFNSIYNFLGSESFNQIYSREKHDWINKAAQIWIAIENPYETQSIPFAIAGTIHFATNGDLLRFEMQIESYISGANDNNALSDLRMCLKLKDSVKDLEKTYHVGVVLQIDPHTSIKAKIPVSALTDIDDLCGDCGALYLSDIRCEEKQKREILLNVSTQNIFRPSISKKYISQIVYRHKELYKKSPV